MRTEIAITVFLLVFLSACQPAESKGVLKTAPKSLESTMNVQYLSSGKNKLVRYTSSESKLHGNVNNIDFEIEALFNSNKKTYTYVMKIRDTGPIPNQGKDGPFRFKLLKISAGVNGKGQSGRLSPSSTSPLYHKGADFLLTGTYQLFENEKNFTSEQFLIESFFENDETIGDAKPGEKTFRGIFNSEESILYE
ncbi:hypothetical protein [Metabacillus sp. 84]|uniref:hypothetical protein n=1 Tax=unclassified Metabacillus TaxID=2675274 RepID=UPI003CE87B0A